MANVVLIVVSVFLASVGQILLKHGMNMVGRITAANLGNFSGLVFRTVSNPFVIFGFLIFGLSSVVWLAVLSRVNVSIAYPFASLAYFFVMVMSWFFLGERVTLLQWGGVSLIWLGLFVLTR